MSTDNCKEKDEIQKSSPVDITWSKLIVDAEHEIDACKDKISKLRKSIGFFRKQESLGLEFPRLGNKT